MGVVTFVMLGTPREVWWLSANEKRMAAARVSKNGVGTDRLKHAEWKWDQVRQAALDPQVRLPRLHFDRLTEMSA